jgi:maltose alpha-D-glucosyltransferase / alpha-amylase
MNPDWIDNAIIYQIYPQSFRDSNGDGIGDLPGIIEKLDYIESIGANVIWLNPIFDSPFGDAGYDVRDFYRIAPRYGTEADLELLCTKARDRGIRIVLDLVAGHTAIDHPWFVAESRAPTSPDSSRYIWRNRDFDPSVGPGRADFVSNFFWHQPALNYGYANPTEPWQDPVDSSGPARNRKELKAIMAYWFDRGVSGFRVDMAASLVKNDPGKRETINLWNEIRRWLDERYPDRIIVAEWSNPSEAIPAGFHIDFMIHFNTEGYRSLFFNGAGTLPAAEGPCYFDSGARGDLELFRNSYARHLESTRGKGLISLPTANHDFQRLRCGARGVEELRPAWTFLMCQAGVPTIYYGDEIGMRFLPEAPPKEGSTLDGAFVLGSGALGGERAGTRTPMQWDRSANAGFSRAAAESLYLPIDPREDRPTVEDEESDPESMLGFVRELVRIRKSHPALGVDGTFNLLNPKDQPYPMVLLREHREERLLVTVNPAGKSVSITVPLEVSAPELLFGERVEVQTSTAGIMLRVEPFGYGIIEL